jgi:ribosomal protein L29
MADAKKPAKKVVNAVEVKTLDDLKKDLATKQKDLMESVRSHRAGELINPRVLGATRKEIARLHTAIRAAEQTATKESN